MRAIQEESKSFAMPFAVRLLRPEDVPQSVEVEREAFPTLFPPTSFQRELRKRMASYLVACRAEQIQAGPPDAVGRGGIVGKLLSHTGGGFEGSRTGRDIIAGFLGTWYMVDEAHIVSVGVRDRYRRSGIGEMLLIAAIEQAMIRGAGVVTLEVRSSNRPAINLYRKYGFSERGVLKSYYADNREDALIMTTEPIQHPDYREFFLKLEREHRRRWGAAERTVA